WGKSSLVAEAMSRYKIKHLTIALDCFGIRSTEEFYERFIQAVLKASSTKIQQAADTVKKYLSALMPYISYTAGEHDEIKISVSLPKEKTDISLLDLPQKIAKDRKLKFIVCIDEF